MQPDIILDIHLTRYFFSSAFYKLALQPKKINFM